MQTTERGKEMENHAELLFVPLLLFRYFLFPQIFYPFSSPAKINSFIYSFPFPQSRILRCANDKKVFSVITLFNKNAVI